MEALLGLVKGVGVTSKTTWAMAIANGIGILVLLGVVNQADADTLKNHLVEIVAAIFAVAPIASRIIKPLIVRFRTGFWSLTGSVILAAVLFQGCATWTPAMGGKTTAETVFKDGTAPYTDEDGVYQPGTITEYQRKVTVPAGVDIKGADGMSYKWTPDGGGSIAINQEGAANTMGQAEALMELQRQQMEGVKSLLDMVLSVANLAAPLVGQNMQNNAALGTLNAQNKAALRAQMIELFKNQAARDTAVDVLTDPAIVTP